METNELLWILLVNLLVNVWRKLVRMFWISIGIILILLWRLGRGRIIENIKINLMKLLIFILLLEQYGNVRNIFESFCIVMLFILRPLYGIKGKVELTFIAKYF